jgi:putative tryptophan/tyrosine transport system substrate-binding protein
MRRRDFITMLGGSAVAWPLGARAQRAEKLPAIGLIGPNSTSVDGPRIVPFVARLGELGWVEGRSITIDYRSAEGVLTRAGEIAAEFAGLKVDVIVTAGDAQVLATKRAGRRR